MKASPEHNSTPLSIDRFELERRLIALMEDESRSFDDVYILGRVMFIIGRMAEEADAGISTFYNHGED